MRNLKRLVSCVITIIHHPDLPERLGLCGAARRQIAAGRPGRARALVILRTARRVASTTIRRRRSLSDHARQNGKAIQARHVAHDQAFRDPFRWCQSSCCGVFVVCELILFVRAHRRRSRHVLREATSSGSRPAASRTSSLPVATSATRQVRYSRRRSISRSRREMALFESASLRVKTFDNCVLLVSGGESDDRKSARILRILSAL